MRNSRAPKIISSVIALWLASLACNTIYRTPISGEAIPINPPTPIAQLSPKDGMEIMFVASGEFIMGSDNGYENEGPAHTVYLDDYWIDKTEVTNAMYYSCMQFGSCPSPTADGFYAPKDHFKDPQKANLPIVFITWYNAQTYCEWAGRRLPTEAEWEKAARGIDGRIYPWGNQEPSSKLLNFDKENFKLMPVGSFPPGASPYGALDMAGNAWEWTADWYDESYYANSPTINPTGPVKGISRITRGGGYFQPADEVRTTFRSPIDPSASLSVDYSFRCAADAVNAPTTTSSR